MDDTGTIGSLLRQLVDLHVFPERRESAREVASRLLESALTTSPSLQTAESLTKSMLFRLVRDGKHTEVSRLATLTAGLKFERAMKPQDIWPILYILNDLRGTAADVPERPNHTSSAPLQSSVLHTDSSPPSTEIVGEAEPSASYDNEKLGTNIIASPRVSLNPFESKPDIEIDPLGALSHSSDEERSESLELESTRKSSTKVCLEKSTGGTPQEGLISSITPQTSTNKFTLNNQSLEKKLAKDLLLIVQGENGSILKFNGDDHDEAVSVALTANTALSRPVHDIVYCVGEVGFLFRVIRRRVEDDERNQKGLVTKNMCRAIVREMDIYYRSLVTLRGKHDRSNLGDEVSEEHNLRQIFVWAAREKPRLRWLALLCDETRPLCGGQVLAHLKRRRRDYVGAEISDMMSRIITSTAAPLNKMLIRWLSEGVLQDSDDEFFIMKDPRVAATMKPAPHTAAMLMEEGGIAHGLAGGPNEASTASHRIWWGLFKLRKHMLPGGIEPALAQKALLTGKSIAFLRRCCGDGEWVDYSHASLVNSLTCGNDPMIDGDPRFHRDIVREIIEKTRNSASGRLKELFFEKFDLSYHFGAIKRYLLLSQGDFTQALMDGLAPVLDGSGDILRSNLTGIVDNALQSSSSFNDETDNEILERLDVQLLSLENKSKVGWDIFSLTYRVEDAPLNTIFSVKVMDAYRLIFRFLWQLKRLDHLMVDAYMNLRDLDERRRATSMVKGYHLKLPTELSAVLKRLHFLRMKMTHLVHNLQHYCTVEVLEGSWSVLEREMSEADDLDGMIYAHSKYLTAIKDRTLLSDRSRYVAVELQKVLETVLVFEDLQKRVCGIVRDHRLKGIMISEEEVAEGQGLDGLIEEVTRLEEAFLNSSDGFLNVLKTHSKIVDTCVFLVSRLDYNKYYSRYALQKMGGTDARSAGVDEVE
ncbi:gamma-tubulin complex component 3 [Gracilaria domingensis]|nr:gamma-tubulin complex component 3 [Gracilaria domingensis]